MIPVSKGGYNTRENLQLLCQKCNLKKGSNIGGEGIPEPTDSEKQETTNG